LTKRKGALYFGAGDKRGGDALAIGPVVVSKPAEMVTRLSKKILELGGLPSP